MRRTLLVASAAAALLVPGRALADTPAVTASPVAGAAPLTTTLIASGGTAPYHWDFGDGTFGGGVSVDHTYAAGAWVATVTDSGGATATVAVHAELVAVAAPPRGAYGKPVVFAGAIVPTTPGASIQLESGGAVLAAGTTTADGSFRLTLTRLTRPGPYFIRSPLAVSAPLTVLVRPAATVTLSAVPFVGRRVVVHGRLRPAGAGQLHVRVWRGTRLVASRSGRGAVRLPLRPGAEGRLRIEVSSTPAEGWTRAGARTEPVVLRALARGAHGPSVRVLEQRLRNMHYALRNVDASFGDDTQDAVWAFQKVHGLTPTGRVDAALWRLVLHGSTPKARYGGSHVEVDKTRQVLFEVEHGKVVLVVHTSTGATGNTPVGVWHVYRRVAGFDWVLYYPTYFLRGFAIHGYPDVPSYPASHGCVRVPMWIAQRLYRLDRYGYTVYVY